MAKVLVETSARHVHVSEKDLYTLFGEGYELTVKKMLSQPASSPARSAWTWWARRRPSPA